MRVGTKLRLIIGAMVFVVAAAGACVYRIQLNAAQDQSELQQRAGEILAEQAVALVGSQGRIVTIFPDSLKCPELKLQMDAFRATLRKRGDYELREYRSKKQSAEGIGTGLSGREYLQAVQDNERADVFVSFAGTPDLTSQELAALG